MVCVSTPSGTQAIANAKIVVEQTATGGLSKMELYNIYDYGDSGTSSSYGSMKGMGDQYNPSDWAGGTFTCYFETTMWTTAGTAYEKLYDNTTSSDVSSELTTTNTSATRVRSSSLTMPSSANDLWSTAKNSGTGTTNIGSASLVIDLTSLQTPENLFPLLPLIIFLPKLAEFIKRRRKLRLAMTQHVGARNKVYFSERKTIASTRRKRPPDTS